MKQQGQKNGCVRLCKVKWYVLWRRGCASGLCKVTYDDDDDYDES